MKYIHLFYSESAFKNNISLIQKNDNIIFMYYVDLKKSINENVVLRECNIFSVSDKKSLINALCESVMSPEDKLFYYY